MAARITVALLAAAALAVGAGNARAAVGTGSPAAYLASLPVPVRCYDGPTYFSASGIAPTDFWLGIAGFWGVPHSESTPVIGLTANTCTAATHLRDGVTLARAYATFTLSHELAHALGTVDETDADCRGASMIVDVARGLGLRGGPRAYATLIRRARQSSGYEPIPASCWAAVSS